MAGLPPGAKLDLTKRSKSPEAVKISLRLLNANGDLQPDKLTGTYSSDTTMWKMLRHFEHVGGDPTGRVLNFTGRGVPQTSNGTQAGSGQLYYEMPVLRINGRDIATLTEYQKTLSQQGISGNQHIQLSFKKTDQTLVDAMAQISQFFQDDDEEPKKDEPKKEEAAEKDDTAAATTTATTVQESSAAPPAEPAEPRSDATTQPSQMDVASQPSQTELSPAASQAVEPSASDPMDVDPPAPRDSLQPVAIFSAPTSSTPAAALTQVPDSAYVPTIVHAQQHIRHLGQRSTNKRLPSDAEIEANGKAQEAKLASIKSVNIKVRFPDMTSAQWIMGPSHTGTTLYQAVRSVMANEAAGFKLKLPAGGPVISDDSGPKHTLIKGYSITSNVVVTLNWDDSVPDDVRNQPFMKDSLASEAKPPVAPVIPEEEDDKEDDKPAPAFIPKQDKGGDGGPKKTPKWLKPFGKK